MDDNVDLTLSGSFRRMKLSSMNTQTRLSFMALWVITAETVLSTPPETAMRAFSPKSFLDSLYLSLDEEWYV